MPNPVNTEDSPGIFRKMEAFGYISNNFLSISINYYLHHRGCSGYQPDYDHTLCVPPQSVIADSSLQLELT